MVVVCLSPPVVVVVCLLLCWSPPELLHTSWFHPPKDVLSFHKHACIPVGVRHRI